MAALRSLIAAFAMFSRIPMPRIELNEKNSRWIMAFFPLVGGAVGFCTLLWVRFCLLFAIGPVLRGAGIALVPVALTGGIHLDGFCDTVDALAGGQTPELRQKILRDPNAGAFAAIWAAAYLVAFAALGSELDTEPGILVCLALLFPFSRCLSGLSVLLFPGAEESSMLRAFSDRAAKKGGILVLILLLSITAACLDVLGGMAGRAAMLTAAFSFLIYERMARIKFGGLSGDLAGWFLQICELASLGALVLIQRILIL